MAQEIIRQRNAVAALRQTAELLKGITSDIIQTLRTRRIASSPLTVELRRPEITHFFSPPANGTSLKAFLLNELRPNARGEFHEEQLQHGVVSFLLGERSEALQRKYHQLIEEYAQRSGNRMSYEEGVKIALNGLVQSGGIAKALAENISAQSFRVAQLDSSLTTLYDDKGGPNDRTVATMDSFRAAEKAEETLLKLRSGALTNTPQDFYGSANQPLNGSAEMDIPKTDIPVKEEKTKSSEPANPYFLWKPTSDSNKNLVILLPAGLSNKAEMVALYKVTKAGKMTLVEKGKFSGIANGERAHFRFQKPGNRYPDGLEVHITLRDGTVLKEKIIDTAKRSERKRA